MFQSAPLSDRCGRPSDWSTTCTPSTQSKKYSLPIWPPLLTHTFRRLRVVAVPRAGSRFRRRSTRQTFGICAKPSHAAIFLADKRFPEDRVRHIAIRDSKRPRLILKPEIVKNLEGALVGKMGARRRSMLRMLCYRKNGISRARQRQGCQQPGRITPDH